MRVAAAVCSLLLWGLIQAGAAQDDNELTTVSRQSKLGLLGGNNIAQLAQDLFTRSTSSSQVLSLNLTNLVILLVVKALIFGAGSLGFGGQDHVGRSLDPAKSDNMEESNQVLSQADVMLMLSYMNGAATQNYDCLYSAACQDPNKAKEYLTASTLLVKAASMFNISTDNEKAEMMSKVDEAIKFGAKGYECASRYRCAV